MFNLKEDLQQAYKLAAVAADKTHQCNKTAYDSRVRSQTLASCDRVLVKNLGLQGKHKLQCRWKDIPCVVVSQIPNLPVYRVKPEDGRGGMKTLHQDDLFAIGKLVRIPREESDHKQPVKPQTRSDTKKKQLVKQFQPRMEEDENEANFTDSSTESEYERPAWRSYRTYLQDILDKRQAAQEQAVVPPDEEELLGVRTEDTNDNSESGEEMENGSQDEAAQGSESDQEEGQARSDDEETSSSVKQVARPKRVVKPVSGKT